MLPKAGKTIDSMKGVYFGNIFSDDFAFDLFWGLLSKPAILENALDSYLSELNHSPSEVCHILKKHYSSLTWGNIKRDDWIDDFYENFFSQITDKNQRNMLEHCFVSDSKLDQFKGELKRALRDITPSYLPEDTLDFEPLEGKNFILNQNNGKVIIITGAVGCGKSTLVTKCVVEARQAKNTYATPIIIDLINDVSKKSIDAKSIVFDYLYKAIKTDYENEFDLDELRSTFSHEIKIMKGGSYKELFKNNNELYLTKEAELLDRESSDPMNMVLKVFQKRKKENRSVIVIIDNVDRASEDFQEEIYGLSHLITQESGATVIITLREFTFFRNKDKGFLDVRPEDKVIHLKAPDFGKLISSRVRYIKEFINEDHRKREWGKKHSLGDFISAMNRHADILRNNLQLSKEGNSVLEILSSVSWHNIRTFYQLIKRVHYQLGSNATAWTKSDAISALMCNIDQGEKTYIPNIFLPDHNVNQCYYLKLRILAFLHDAISQGEMSKGVVLERIIRFLLLYGYKRDWIIRAIEEAIKERVIECIEIPSDSDLNLGYKIQSNHSFRISPLGVSLILDICHTPIYIALTSIDLPFHESKPYNEIKNEFEVIVSCMAKNDISEVNTDFIDLLLESNIPKTAAQYLTSEFEKEKLSFNRLKNQTEINLTEKRISKIVLSTMGIFNKVEYRAKNIQSSQYILPFSLEDESYISDKELPSCLVPSTLQHAIDNDSEYVPLIFVALVIRAHLGFEASIGVEITDIINDHLVDEDNKKFTNNVSRSLRSKKLITQDWLLIRTDLHPKFKKFSLSQNWKESWMNIFNEVAPSI